MLVSRARRVLSFARHVRRSPVYAVGCALVLVGCSGGENVAQVVTVDENEAPLQLTVPTPTRDVQAPVFDGVQRVDLLGEGIYRLTWSPGRDDMTRSGNLGYQVYHTLSPTEIPAPDARPVAAALPGETNVIVELPPIGGRFFVRAIDEAGNTSAWGEGLEQRATHPWVRRPDGSRLSNIEACISFEPGRAICVGDDGFAARWDRDTWVPLQAAEAADLRFTKHGNTVRLYSNQGHLYELNATWDLVPVPPTFQGATPVLPMRQFVAGPDSLLYWIDQEGQTFIGTGTTFRAMARPLGVPGDACTRLRGMAFGSRAGFAVCLDGAVYSVALSDPSLRWLPLTSATPFELPAGLRSADDDTDSSALVMGRGGLYRVGVGGWNVVLGVGTDADEPRRLSEPLTHGGRLWVPSDRGLWTVTGDNATLVAGLVGDVVSVIPPNPLEPQDLLQIVFRDGAVATWQNGRRNWRVQPPPTGFVLGGIGVNETIYALAGADSNTPGVHRWGAQGWVQVAPLPATLNATDAEVVTGVPGRNLTILAGGTDTAGWIAEWSGGWRQPSWLAPAPIAPRPPPRIPPVVDPNAPPPPPPPPPSLSGVPLARGAVAVSPPTRFVDLNLHADGRGIAITETSVWWRQNDGWLWLTDRPGPLQRVALDAGESYVLHEGDQLVRCWRGDCGGAVPAGPMAPTDVRASWRGESGLVVLQNDGATALFVPESLPEGARLPIRMEDTPAGSWADVADPLPFDAPADVVSRATFGDYDVLLTADGGLYTRVDENWLRQRTSVGPLALFALRDGWALLTQRGLLRLGEVQPVVRGSQ